MRWQYRMKVYRWFGLASIDKMDTVAVIGSLPSTIPAAEFAIPEKGIERTDKRDRRQSEADC